MIRRILPLMIGLASVPLLSGCPGAEATRVPASEAPISFEDVTAAAGIRFKHFTGADGRYRMPESIGPGGAFLDHDGDGNQDVFLVNARSWPDRPVSGTTPALYRNLGNGRFADVTREAGLAVSLFGLGCAVGDYDNDGDDDLLVTCVGPSRLFRNDGGRFRDVTAASGIDGGSRWSVHTGAAWFDYNRDGRLDLFVARYVKWSPETEVPCRTGAHKATYCPPAEYDRETSELYLNLGGGRFREVTREMGLGAGLAKGFVPLPLDENEDGWPDLFLTSDMTPNLLWRNEGGKRFIEVAQEAGVAVGDTGEARAGMGTDVADLRGDGGLQLAIGNFSAEGLALFDRRAGYYVDTARAELRAPSLRWVTFGLSFLDADRDGWQELLTYNGHLDPYASETDPLLSYAQPPGLFKNRNGSFTEVGAAAGLQEAQVGRGSAVGDWDNDGRPDLLLCENGGPARLLRNTTADHHGWLGVRLRGTNSNGNGYGAEIRLTAGGRTQRRWVRSGGSYLSHCDSRALFGLGTGTPEKLEVRWPSGKTILIEHPSPNAYLTVVED